MSHQIPAEGIDFVLFNPSTNRIINQLSKHAIFRCGIRAASRILDLTTPLIQALVVPRDDAIQYRFIRNPRFVGVVVNHIHHHIHPNLLFDRLHHLTKFFDAGNAVRLSGIRAFRHGVVERIIAPVEAIHITQKTI
ncbi:Uncharacterised protein [Vibrio cholerae]|nr:Uncharacterised protein [Vibrio cholerae]CSA99437.1 Uncharacterised protein [Vibrio cholerae]CSB07572.1 Uncharacterised protein [Vibrio cholerae]CSD13376.1 Uncharacterised protein [Vibrio cholerae]